MSSAEISAAAPALLRGLLTLSRPGEFTALIQSALQRIAGRAFELYEARGREPGHDWQDWFQAESELLRAVPIEMQVQDERIIVRANVLGFEPAEVKASVEARRLVVAGKKQPSPEESNKVFYVDWYPDEILRVVDLPAEIIPELATATLVAGVLEFSLPTR